MKHSIVLSFLMLLPLSNFSQENKKLHFSNISFSFPAIIIPDGDAGLALNLSTELSKGKHVYKLFLQAGSEFNIGVLGPPRSKSYSEINGMYGHTLNITSWLYTEGFIGIGLFWRTITIPKIEDSSGGSSPNFGGFYFGSSNNYTYQKEQQNAIGIPIQLKVGFNMGKRFSMGILTHANINSIETVSSIGINFSWKLGNLTTKN